MRQRAVCVLLAFVVACGGQSARGGGEPSWDVAAVRFGALAGFRVRSLIAGADSARRVDATLMVWPLQAADGRIVLVDAGFTRAKFITQWKPRDYVTPDSALRLAGYDPAKVTDIVISHIHWDHADGVERFPGARVWLQREEFETYVGPAGEAKQPAIDPEVAAMYRRLFTEGRVRLVDGDGVEIIPGIRVHTGGKHTFASQFVSVHTAAGPIVIASDNAYLYENLEQRRPIAQTLDSLSNLAAQARMLAIAGSARFVVPGHDPAVFTRFPEGPPRKATIRR
jgi:glyoxylase-like metal-dependent hydrolase (beta-lactamase superfamily II)